MRKVLYIFAMIALYDICGFCLIHEFNVVALLSWGVFTGIAALQLFVMTTKLVIMLLELPRRIQKEDLSSKFDSHYAPQFDECECKVRNTDEI